MSLSLSAADWLFKRLYPEGLDEEALVRNKPLMQWTESSPDFTNGNKGLDIPAPYVNPQGIGPTNVIASTNESGSAGVVFTVPQRTHIHFGKVDSNVVRNTIAGGSESQFVNVLTREVDGATEAIGVEIAQRMYGDNSGVRSYLSSTGAVTGTTAFLANVEDAQFYEINMKVAFINPADGAYRNAGASLTVTAVDPIAGTLTLSGNVNSVTGTVAGDGIVRAGFRNADLDGLKGWVPVTPSANFLGVNQTLYRTRLAGVYVDVSNLPIRSAFLKAFAVAQAQIGARFQSKSPIFIHPTNLMQIQQSVEGVKVINGKMDDKFGIGLDTVEVLGYRFVSDAHCPVNEAFLIGDGAFVRATAGKQPRIDDQDGRKFDYDRVNGALSFVLAHDGNTYSPNPGNIMRMKLPAGL